MTTKTNGGIIEMSGEVAKYIKERSDEAAKVGLNLADTADQAAFEMVKECEELTRAVREGTERMRAELREKMVEFSTVMRDYSEAIAAKHQAYIEAGQQSIQAMEGNINALRKATQAVAGPKEAVSKELVSAALNEAVDRQLEQMQGRGKHKDK